MKGERELKCACFCAYGEVPPTLDHTRTHAHAHAHAHAVKYSILAKKNMAREREREDLCKYARIVAY